MTEHKAHKPARKRRQRIEVDVKRAAARPDRKTAGGRERVRPDPRNGGRRRKEVERMQRMTGGAYLTNAERLKEIADTITAATIARRYAATDWEREKINEIIERASAEKYRILEI